MTAAVTAAELAHTGPWVARKSAEHVAEAERQAPPGFVPAIRAGYRRHLAAEGHRAANLYAGGVMADLANVTRGTAGEDSAIRVKAQRQAERVHLATMAKPWDAARPLVEFAARKAGVPAPDGDHDEAAVRRGRCPLWWRRTLRREVGRGVEAAARRMGLVRKGGQLYVSDETLERHRGQKARNRALLETLVAVNEAGQEYTLQELADLSVSNPKLRRHELMTRIRGTEEMATAADHRAAFWTLTTPSRFHPVRVMRSGKVLDNPRWDGSSPREAQHYLRDLWARVRAAWKRAGIEPYGVRVAEPHHDGTPHWHLLLFLPECQAAEADRIFRAHALAEAPDEPGAADHRLRTEWIDPDQGTATGYVAKYIAKAVDGHALERDLYGADASEAAARIAAWASTWGIRQFQFMGAPPVTLWREVRRLDGAPPGPLGDAYAAADAGNWRRFAEVVAAAPGLATVKAEGEANRYGEVAAPRPYGVVEPDTGEVFVTRKRTWAIGFPAEARRAWTKERPADALRRMGQARIDYPITKHAAALAAAVNYAKEARNGNKDVWGKGGWESSLCGGGIEGNRLEKDCKEVSVKEKRSCDRQREKGAKKGVKDFGGGREAGGVAAGPWTRVNNCTRGGSDGRRNPPEDRGGAKPAQGSAPPTEVPPGVGGVGRSGGQPGQPDRGDRAPGNRAPGNRGRPS